MTVELAVRSSVVKLTVSLVVVGRVAPDQLACAPQLPEALPLASCVQMNVAERICKLAEIQTNEIKYDKYFIVVTNRTAASDDAGWTI